MPKTKNFTCLGIKASIASRIFFHFFQLYSFNIRMILLFMGCLIFLIICNRVEHNYLLCFSAGKTCSCVDSELYHVLCYMIVFRLDELGLAHFNKFIDSQNVLKMYRYTYFWYYMFIIHHSKRFIVIYVEFGMHLIYCITTTMKSRKCLH